MLNFSLSPCSAEIRECMESHLYCFIHLLGMLHNWAQGQVFILVFNFSRLRILIFCFLFVFDQFFLRMLVFSDEIEYKKSYEVALAIISPRSVNMCFLIVCQCRWRECIPTKCWYPLTELRSAIIIILKLPVVDCVWNVMAHAQKPDFVFRRNGRVHINRRGRQFSRLLAAELCASAVVMVVMLDTCFEVVWRVLATHSIP
jgi:hypothetical protein